MDCLAAQVIEVYLELQGRLVLWVNQVSMEALDLPVVKDRREPLDPVDRSEIREILGRLDWLDSLDGQDSQGHGVRADHQDSRVIRVRWVTAGHPGLLEVSEILDRLGEKVPSDHLDRLDCLATPECQEFEGFWGYKDSLEFQDLQVNCTSRHFDFDSD